MKRASILAVAAALVIFGGQAAMAVEKGKAEGTGTKIKVEECYSKRASLKGKKVTVSGKAVKVNMAIMGKNWVHLQDGTGDQAKGTHNLVATTQDLPSIGDIVTATGTFAFDQATSAGRIIISDGSDTTYDGRDCRWWKVE